MSCITRSSLRLSNGCVSWILMLHMGQYLLVCKYFTIQLLQTAQEKDKERHFILFRMTPSGLNMSLFLWNGTLMNKNGFTFWPTPFKLTCVQTLCNCCGIYEVTRTKVADNVFVQVLDLQLDLLLLGRTERCFKSWKNVDEHNASLSSFKLRANISPHLTLTINI